MLVVATGKESRGNLAGDELIAVLFHDTNVSVWELSLQVPQVLNPPRLRFNERVRREGVRKVERDSGRAIDSHILIAESGIPCSRECIDVLVSPAPGLTLHDAGVGGKVVAKPLMFLQGPWANDIFPREARRLGTKCTPDW